MRVFGLTGNIGSGKSSVAAMFREEGIPMLDVDRISREVTAPGERAYRRVIEAFGAAILRPDGAIDRKRLGEIVFANAEHRARLEEITHPAILDAMKEALSALSREGHRAAIVEAALVYETGRKGILGKVISVRCDEGIQVRRLMDRDGITREQAVARIGAQMDAEEKARSADYVIDNSGSLENTRRQVRRIARILLGP